MEKNLKAPMVSALEVFESIKDSLKKTEKPSEKNLNQSIKISHKPSTSQTNGELKESMVIKTIQEEMKEIKAQLPRKGSMLMKPSNPTPAVSETKKPTIAVKEGPDVSKSMLDPPASTRNSILAATVKVTPSNKLEIQNAIQNHERNKNNLNASMDSKAIEAAKKNADALLKSNQESESKLGTAKKEEANRSLIKRASTVKFEKSAVDKQMLNNTTVAKPSVQQQQQNSSNISTSSSNNSEVKPKPELRKQSTMANLQSSTYQSNVSKKDSSTSQRTSSILKQPALVVRQSVMTPATKTEIILEKEYSQNNIDGIKDDPSKSSTTKNISSKKVDFNATVNPRSSTKMTTSESTANFNSTIGAISTAKVLVSNLKTAVSNNTNSLQRTNSVLFVNKDNKTNSSNMINTTPKHVDSTKQLIKKESLMDVSRNSIKNMTTVTKPGALNSISKK